MSDAAATEEEPSIEEILDSIKQIIADEDDEAVEDTSAEDVPVADEDDDVLVLTETVAEEPAAAEPESEPEPIEEEAVSDPEPEPEPIEEEEPAVEIDLQDTLPQDEPPEVDLTDIIEESEPVKPSETVVDAGAILTEKVQTAAIDNFTGFIRKTNMERGAGVTLEDIVRSELNPLLREWLDEYMPDIIERLVQEELKEITKRILD